MRKLLSLLVIAAILAGFAVPAYADVINENLTTMPENIAGDTVVTNNGTIETNNGTVGINNWEVGVNNGTVETNDDYVGTNNGTVETNDDIVSTNNGTVETNNDYVGNNGETGVVNKNNDYVSMNAGTVGINNGTVNINDGIVYNNNGTVVYNYGTVENAEGGVVTCNYGTIKNGGDVLYAVVYDDDMEKEPEELVGFFADNALNGEFTVMTKADAEAAGFVKAGYKLVGFTCGDKTYQPGAAATTDAPLFLVAMYDPITNEFIYVPAYSAGEMVGGVVTLKANRVMYRSAELAAKEITVDVDGAEVAADSYTVELDAEGDITITLSKAFLSTLTAGEHAMTICFANGIAYTFTFTK